MSFGFRFWLLSVGVWNPLLGFLRSTDQGQNLKYMPFQHQCPFWKTFRCHCIKWYTFHLLLFLFLNHFQVGIEALVFSPLMIESKHFCQSLRSFGFQLGPGYSFLGRGHCSRNLSASAEVRGTTFAMWFLMTVELIVYQGLWMFCCCVSLSLLTVSADWQSCGS